MRKTRYDGLLRGSLEAINVKTWGKNNFLMHPKRIHSDTDDFTIIGKTCLTRMSLETERRIFGNTEEIDFAESGENCDISLLDRQKATLLLDKRA